MGQIDNGISAVVIARNEEGCIDRCLKNLQWASERILVDNASQDATVRKAQAYHVRVIASNAYDFARLRMIGLENAKYGWILYIDADETVTPALRDEILKTIDGWQSDSPIQAYYLVRDNYYLGNKWPYKDKLPRLFRKKALKDWTGKVHETPHIDGQTGLLSEPLIHDAHRTLEEMVSKTNDWSDIEAELRIKAQHPLITWWRLLRVMVSAFLDSFLRQGGWKAGMLGWVESIYQAFSMFITYAKLWEMQHVRNETV